MERYAEEYWRRKAELRGSMEGPVFTVVDGAVGATYAYDYAREWRAKGVSLP
jgi:hypothetical protein